MSKPNLAIIAALAKNNAIGLNNKMPWNAPKDLKHFAKTTKDSVVIFGRKTYSSIGGALPNRKIIVVSKSLDVSSVNINNSDTICRSLDEAIDTAIELSDKTIWIAGGANIYQQAIAKVDRMILSHFEKEFPGDTFFPEFEIDQWRVAELHLENTEPKFIIKEYIRK